MAGYLGKMGKFSNAYRKAISEHFQSLKAKGSKLAESGSNELSQAKNA
jgi:hypothetical protein